MLQTMARKSKTAVVTSVESIVNDETKVFTDAPTATRQGDLYFVKLDTMPASAKPRKDRQLADGNTQGSRHICTVGAVFTADAAEVAILIRQANKTAIEPQYIGPIFTGPAYISHPEHGDHDFQCLGVFAVVTQRCVDAEERAQRVQD